MTLYTVLSALMRNAKRKFQAARLRKRSVRSENAKEERA